MNSKDDNNLENDEFTAREATEDDLPKIADLFARHDYGTKKEEWLRWKFLDNPDGKALMYVIEDSQGTVVGFQARMPRRFTSLKSGPVEARQQVDMFIDERYRGRSLRRKIPKIAGPKRYYIQMGFPNKRYRRMMKINELSKAIPMEAWWFPLKAGKLIADKPYGFIAPLINILSPLYAAIYLRGSRKGLEMKKVERFERDFEIDPNLIHASRSADYLNWRFIDNPMRDFFCFEFFDGADSVGYCVFAIENSVAEIFDLITSCREKECLRLLVAHCRSQGFSHLSFRMTGLDLKHHGFIMRESPGDFVVSGKKDRIDLPEGAWFVTLVDSDH